MSKATPTWLQRTKEKAAVYFACSRKARAKMALATASGKVDEIETSIKQQIESLEQEHGLHRRILQSMVSKGAARHEIMSQTHKVSALMKQLNGRRNLLSNMSREKRQLASVSMNTSVACVMKESLDAQKLLSRATCSNAEIDDVLDDADELRQDADELSDRLGAIDIDTTLETDDADAFDIEKVKHALGLQVHCVDELAMDELQQIVSPLVDNITGHPTFVDSPLPIAYDDFPSAPNASNTTTDRAANWHF